MAAPGDPGKEHGIGGENLDDLTRFHGTMVAGALRQSVPSASITSYQATLPRDADTHQPSSTITAAPHVAEEQMIINAISRATSDGVTILVMAFGGETIEARGNKPTLESAVEGYLSAAGNKIFAAAGNLFDGGPQGDMYPASWAGVEAVGGGQNKQPYDWSNWFTGTTLIDVTTGAPDRGGYLAVSCFGPDTAAQLVKPSGDYFVMAQGTSLLVPIAVGQYLSQQAKKPFANPFPGYV